MSALTLNGLSHGGQIVCLGAHCDDVEIGCGATLLALTRKYPDVELVVIIFCSDKKRSDETRASLSMLLGEKISLKIFFGGFRDGFLPYQAIEAKEFLADIGRELSPDVVFTHYRQDLHQDHRYVSEIAYQVFRAGLTLEMEILKYDGDMGRPNVYFPAGSDDSRHKIATLMACYESQKGKYWFNEEVFTAPMRIRGVECRSESGLAEAFYSHKVIVA